MESFIEVIRISYSTNVNQKLYENIITSSLCLNENTPKSRTSLLIMSWSYIDF